MAILNGDIDRADDYLEKARTTAGGGTFTDFNTIMTRIISNDIEQAVQLAEVPDSGFEGLRKPLLALVYAVSGRTDEAQTITDELVDSNQENIFVALALQELGDLMTARRVIGDIDSSPGGFIQFIYTFKDFGGAMPFDLQWAPNFSERLAEAGVTVERFEFPLPVSAKKVTAN